MRIAWRAARLWRARGWLVVANPTKVSVQGNVVEVTELEYRNKVCAAIKVDKEHWVDLDGVRHEYQKCSTKRTDNTQELLKTFATIRALVNTNCKRSERIRWITLTYAENMQDTKRLYADFKNFWTRFKRRWGVAEYIVVMEPQGRGAWHAHLIAIYPDVAPYIPNAELRACWGNGFVRVNAVDDIDNLGAYLSAYLADVVVDDGGTPKLAKDGTSKMVKKGGRLNMYPRGMNIYRCSRGIKRPDVFWCESGKDWQRLYSIIGNRQPVYDKLVTFRDDEGVERHVYKAQYNLVRS